MGTSLVHLLTHQTTMTSSMDTDKKDAAPTDVSKDAQAAAVPPKPHTLQEDIQHNLSLIHSAVSILEPRLTTKVLRTTGAIRKRLLESDDGKAALTEVIQSNFPEGDKQRNALVSYLDGAAAGAGAGMQVDGIVESVVNQIKGPLSKLVPSAAASSDSSTPATTPRPATPSSAPKKEKEEFLPESEIYLTLLVIVYLLDTKQLEKSMELADATVIRLGQLNRRTMDQLAAKVYFFYGRLHELVGGSASLSGIRPQLLTAQRLAALRHDDDLQATLLNLLLRNYFAFNLYDQADKLIAKTTFPETAGNPQLARWMYYVGRIRAIQLNYSEAHSHLQQAVRRAPTATVAPGFLQTVYKLFIVVELLMGDIPERSVFRQPVLKKALGPYLQIVQAVRVGDLQAFTTALAAHQKQFLADSTYTLILRLRHTVIKTALRQLSLSYSKIPLQEITRKLHLDSEEEAEYIVAKSIRDNVIEASLEHEKGFMKSKDFSLNIYNTNEPQKMFDQRIGFCLQLHNESVKAMRFPMKTHQKELNKAADARERERELAAEIEQNGPDDDEEGDGEL